MVQALSGDGEKPLDPEAARILARVRRLMMIASLTTFVVVAVVLGIIGYRVFRTDGRASVPETVATLPPGAKVLSSAIGDGRIVLTVEIDGAVELRSFDLNTLKPLGQVRLAPQR